MDQFYMHSFGLERELLHRFPKYIKSLELEDSLSSIV